MGFDFSVTYTNDKLADQDQEHHADHDRPAKTAQLRQQTQRKAASVAAAASRRAKTMVRATKNAILSILYKDFRKHKQQIGGGRVD